MIVNQWIPAAHRGDAVGDNARIMRDLFRAWGHESEIYALTIDPDLAAEIRPWRDAGARQGDVTILHFAIPSPMTQAFATLPGARVLRPADEEIRWTVMADPEGTEFCAFVPKG